MVIIFRGCVYDGLTTIQWLMLGSSSVRYNGWPEKMFPLHYRGTPQNSGGDKAPSVAKKEPNAGRPLWCSQLAVALGDACDCFGRRNSHLEDLTRRVK